jgi:hypothetical protein
MLLVLVIVLMSAPGAWAVQSEPGNNVPPVSSAPEPVTVILLGAGLATMAIRRKLKG